LESLVQNTDHAIDLPDSKPADLLAGAVNLTDMKTTEHQNCRAENSRTWNCETWNCRTRKCTKYSTKYRVQTKGSGDPSCAHTDHIVCSGVPTAAGDDNICHTLSNRLSQHQQHNTMPNKIHCQNSTEQKSGKNGQNITKMLRKQILNW